MTLTLYITTVLIWGSSWIMFDFQTGIVSPEVSGAYRFGIAALFMFIWAKMNRETLRFAIGEHTFLALQGAFMFALNIVFLYLAAWYLPSGLNAVVFSMASIISMGAGTFYYRKAPSMTLFIGGLIGVLGVVVVFWPEIKSLELKQGVGLGLLLSLAGTTSFAISLLIGERNQRAGLGGHGGLAWAMTYGTLVMCVIAVFRDSPFTFDSRFSYVGSLIFLIVFNSVIAFSVYFALLKRIGAERSAYVTVLFPIVALVISTIFENYQWTLSAFIGVALTLIGNVLILRNSPRAKVAPTKSKFER